MTNPHIGFYQINMTQYYPDNGCINLILDLYSVNNMAENITNYKQLNKYDINTIKEFYSKFVYITICINMIDNLEPYNYHHTINHSILQNIGIVDRNIISSNKIPFMSYEQLYMIMMTNECHYS